MSKGGVAPKRAGDTFEVAVLRDQEALGRYCRRLRQGGGEPVDLVATERCTDAYCTLGLGTHHLFLIQVKARKVGKRADPLNLMSPAERAALRAEAERWGAVALLAYKQDGAICYMEVSHEP